MDKKYTKSNKKAASFLKRNIYYIIMAVCILAIAAMVTLTIINKNKVPVIDDPIETPIPDTDPDPTIVDPDPDTNTDADPIVFALPSNGAVFLDYVMDMVVWHGTLGQYSVHNGIDFQGEEGDLVLAAYGGVVESVSLDDLEGNKIVINHGDDLRTIYYSLGEVKVSVGDDVEKGTAIGTVGMTATKDLSSGNHVHFMVTQDNVVLNPYNYFAEGEK